VALIVLPTLASELPALEQRLPLLLDGFDRAIRPLLVQAGLNVPLDSAGLKSLLAQQLSNMDSTGISWLDWLKKGSSAVIGWVATLLLVPIVLFYLLLDWHHVIARFATIIPRRWISLVTEMSRETDHLLAQYLRGQLLVMLLLATYYSVALTIAGFEVAAPVGIITGLLVFIPYVGYGIGLTLAILSAILFFDGWHGLIAVGVVYGIGQMLESFYLTPRLVGERIGLHPLTVIFALLAFAQLFGFTGILVALPASAILSVVYRRVRQHYLNSSFYNQS
jgi:predicted PurR-regulated permease PerM